MIPRREPYENSPPLRFNIITVATPGITSPRAQLSRYTGVDGVDVLENACSWEPAMNYFDNIIIANNNNNNNNNNNIIINSNDNILNIPSEVSSLLKGSGPYILTSEIDPPLLYHAKCKVAPRLLHNVIASPEMDEMVYGKWTFNPIHWLLILKEYITGFVFSVKPIRSMYSRVRMTNLGGERDQAACQREVRRAVRIIKEHESRILLNNNNSNSNSSSSRKNNSEDNIVINNNNNNSNSSSSSSRKNNSEDNMVINNNNNNNNNIISPERPIHLKLVLFGCSRGATTTLYTALKLPAELAKYISLVVIEAPFDTLHNVINSSCWFPRFTLWFFKTFCDYSENEAYSFDPSKVYITCPIAFVLSVKDTRVPNKLTKRLIKTIKAECPQIPAVEVLELQHSRHPLMAVGHKEDQDAYVAFMERLYDTYCS